MERSSMERQSMNGSEKRAERQRREDQIKALERAIEDIKQSMPAHSVKPRLILELEQLEDELALLTGSNK